MTALSPYRRAWADVWPPAAIFLGLVLLLSHPLGLWMVPVAGVSAGTLVWAGDRYALPGLRELARYVAGFLAFTAFRHVADDLGPAPFVQYPVTLDRLLGLGTVPTVWLQAHLPAWTVYPAVLVYGSYFLIPPLVVGLVWRCWPARLRPLVSATLAAFLVAGVVHVLLPTAPPWMAGQAGLVAVRPLVLDYYHVAIPTVYAAGVGVSSNPVAAMPSVHLAVTTLLCCALWPTRLRGPALAYLAAMALTVVYSGDHYAVDVLAGMSLALACWRWAR